MKNRIKKIRRDFDLTQQEFADRLGIKRGGVSNYEIGRNIPSDSVISLICREFNISEEWLRNGTGDMFLPADRNKDIEKLTNILMKEESDSFKNRFVSMLANLTVDEWEFLERKAKELCGVDSDSSSHMFDDIPDDPHDLERMFPPVENNTGTNVI